MYFGRKVNMENDIKIRNSSIELLRIIAILFIITGHYSVHNGFDNRTITFGVNRVILDISKLGSIGIYSDIGLLYDRS